MTDRLFKKDFTLVVLGQIISLFGNNILRFALPLYILTVSESPALFGIVSATAFIPMIIMSPIGGIITDRVYKQRIMVVLDLLTAALIFGFIVLNQVVSLTPLVIVFLMLLYGIQGAYQPAVQASMPLLVSGEQLVPANAVINLVQSLSGLLGPVIGGMLYAAYGLLPILNVSLACFLFSGIMEMFIKIPHKKQKAVGSILEIVKSDMSQSLRFIVKENPILLKGIGLVLAINLFMSTMLMIGIPVVITQNLALNETYYGITQGVMAAGGLTGGLLAGTLGRKMDIRKIHVLLLFASATILPMSLVLFLPMDAMARYFVITVMGFFIMAGSTLFSIQMLAFIQAFTPQEIVGKVLSCLMAFNMCAMPVGQFIYGILFERFLDASWAIILGAAILSIFVSLYSKKVFGQLPANQEQPA